MIVLRNKRINKLISSAFFFIPLLLLITSCSKRPETVLSRVEMQDLLYDLHKTDGVLEALDIPARNIEERQIYYQTVLDYHHTNQAQFDSSIVWYTAHPKKFEKIYLHVLKRIEKELSSQNISNLPTGIDCPDIHYWKNMGNISIDSLPDDLQRSLYIILNRYDKAFQMKYKGWMLLPIPNKRHMTPTKLTSDLPKFFTAQPKEK